MSVRSLVGRAKRTPQRRAISSGVEHYVDIVGVGGSNPPSPISYIKAASRLSSTRCGFLAFEFTSRLVLKAVDKGGTRRRRPHPPRGHPKWMDTDRNKERQNYVQNFQDSRSKTVFIHSIRVQRPCPKAVSSLQTIKPGVRLFSLPWNRVLDALV